MNNKEKNFISAVVYINSNTDEVLDFFKKVDTVFSSRFENYEYVAINNVCSSDTIAALKNWASGISKPLTIINMSIKHSAEACMNAGIDIAIGDYVYEFDTTAISYPVEKIYEAYTATLEGNDIVSVCPVNNAGKSSSLFYRLFNSSSRSKYKLRTEVFRIITRRAINRVHASNEYLPYRKAAYAASGLKIKHIEFEGKAAKDNSDRFSLAIDSLALYTNLGLKIGIGISLFMTVLSLLEIIYTVVIFCTGQPIEGWTTTMLVVTVGFTGLFVLLTLVIKYLMLVIDLIFRKQKYLVESIEKIQK